MTLGVERLRERGVPKSVAVAILVEQVFKSRELQSVTLPQVSLFNFPHTSRGYIRYEKFAVYDVVIKFSLSVNTQ